MLQYKNRLLQTARRISICQDPVVDQEAAASAEARTAEALAVAASVEEDLAEDRDVRITAAVSFSDLASATDTAADA